MAPDGRTVRRREAAAGGDAGRSPTRARRPRPLRETSRSVNLPSRARGAGRQRRGRQPFGDPAAVGCVLGAATLLLGGCAGGPRESAVAGPLDFERQAGELGMVDLDDEQRVHARGRDFLLRCAGSGGAGGVMLVSGQAAPKETWEPIQVRLGSVARVCSYDRPGVGTNLDEPPSQTFVDMAADLDAVIRAARLPRPLVVVGHSMGGPVAASWAAAHPADVGAVVLLDPASYQYLAELIRQELGAAGPVPADRVLVELRKGSGDRSVNPERVRPRAWMGLGTLPALGDMPMAVLRHGAVGVDFFPVTGDRNGLEKAWVTGQEAWASTSTAATLVEVQGSSHTIHGDRPLLALSAILWALDTAAD